MTQDGSVGVDYGALFDEHMADEFALRSVEATMSTMTAEPVVLHVPTSMGGRGGPDVERFYRDHFIGTFPDDFAATPVSRTVGAERLVDEMIVSFTHDREVPIFLPGVAATGRTIRIPVVVVVGFADGKVASEHIYWDGASMLVQAGLLDPTGLPVRGAEETTALLAGRADNVLLANRVDEPAG